MSRPLPSLAAVAPSANRRWAVDALYGHLDLDLRDVIAATCCAMSDRPSVDDYRTMRNVIEAAEAEQDRRNDARTP